MKKIYTLANMAKGMMLAALLAVGTTALAQNVSGNTENGTVEGTENGTVEGNENGSNENETFAPAAESSWLQPVKLVGNGQKAYIYNVATETFITGKTATVKNIKDADVWTIDGDETRSFTCDNESKDRLFLESIYAVIPIYKWHAEVSDDKDATVFTIVEGSTENSYKLTKSRKKFLGGIETAYFSVSGENYEASLEPSINNDWYFISTDQKEVYAEYTSLFTEAANLLKNEKLNDQESVLGAIKTALQKTAKGTFNTSNADINTLKTTIAAAKKAIEDITNGISNTSDNLENAEITSIYSANGTRKNQLTKGINIVKMSNGAVKKILVK
uniref:hypothetical protein n=1 Tax=Segatella hominis TaxID=2518605 RepID=UPI004029A23F